MVDRALLHAWPLQRGIHVAQFLEGAAADLWEWMRAEDMQLVSKTRERNLSHTEFASNNTVRSKITTKTIRDHFSATVTVMIGTYF